MPRKPKIDEETRDEIIHELQTAIQEDLSDRMEWVEHRVKSFESWVLEGEEPVDYPWEGASNITPPLVAKAVRGLHARLVASIFNADPLVHVLPVDAKNRDNARAREKYLNWQLRNDIPSFYREISTALLQMLVQGDAFVMVWHERKREMVPEWHIVERYESLNPMLEPVERIDEAILEELIPEIDRAKSLGNHTYKVRHRSEGFKVESRVSIDRDDDEVPDDRISVTLEREQFEERIRVKTLPIEDLVVPSNATGLQADDCHHVFRLYWQYPGQIRRKFELGEYPGLEEEDVVRLEELASHEEPLPSQTTGVRQAEDAYQGFETVNGLSGIKSGKVLTIDCFYPWDVNGDKVEEEVTFVWIPELTKLADWDYTAVRFGHNRRPFVHFPFLPLVGRFYSISLAEILESIQDEAATLLNQMNDRGNLTNNPVLLVEHNAGISPNVFKQIPPGSVVPVRNVERVRPLEWSKSPFNEAPLLQQLYAFSEQLSIGDLSVGVTPNRPNAPRTARGTMALIAEANVLVDTHIMNIQAISFEELIHQIDGLNRQYLAEEKTFYITGERDPLVLKKEDLKERAKFYFSATTTNTNTQVRMTVAQFLYQTLITNPIMTGQVMQMPQISIQAIYRLTEYLIREMTPGKDASFIIPALEEVLQFADQMQQQQLQGMQQGKQEAQQQAEQMMQREEQGQLQQAMMKGGGGSNGSTGGASSGGSFGGLG